MYFITFMFMTKGQANDGRSFLHVCPLVYISYCIWHLHKHSHIAGFLFLHELSQQSQPPAGTSGAPWNVSIRAWMLNWARGCPLFNLPILDQHLRERKRERHFWTQWPSCLVDYPICRDTLLSKCFLKRFVWVSVYVRGLNCLKWQ